MDRLISSEPPQINNNFFFTLNNDDSPKSLKIKKKMDLPRVMEIGQYIHMISITKKVLIIWTFHIDKTVYPVNIDPFAMKINRGHNQVIDNVYKVG